MRQLVIATLAVAAALSGSGPVQAAPPPNDDFEAARPITSIFQGTLEEATRQPGEPGEGRSIWFAFRPPAPGRYSVQRVSEFAESPDRVAVSVHTGERVDGLERVDVPDENDPMFRATFVAAASTVYRIRVAVPTEYEDMGDRWRVIAAPMPANDDFADAERLAIPGRYRGFLADATAERGEPDHAGWRAQRSLWYRLRPTRTGRLSIATDSPDCQPSMSVYTGSGLRSLRRRASRESYEGTLRFIARRGRTYWLALDCDLWTAEQFELTISDGSIAGKGVTLAPRAGQTVESVIARGLRADVKTRRKTTVGIALVVRPPAARALGLHDRVLGRARKALGYRDREPVAIRLTREARVALEGRETLSAFLRLTLLNSSAPNRVLIVPVELPTDRAASSVIAGPR